MSKNAVRHGLRSPCIVIPGLELQNDWDQFLADALTALAPIGAVEYALAERVATLLWRLRRAPRAERDAAIAIARRRAFEGGPAVSPPAALVLSLGRQFFPEEVSETLPAPRLPPEPPAVLPEAQVLQTLSKYEARLSRQLLHALHELQALQDRRQGRDAPLTRIDVDVQGLPGVE